VVSEVLARTGFRLGMPLPGRHRLRGANTLAAGGGRVTHVQCTANGTAERVGNAGLFAVLGGLVTNRPGRAARGLPARAGTVSHAIADIANMAPDAHQAHVIRRPQAWQSTSTVDVQRYLDRLRGRCGATDDVAWWASGAMLAMSAMALRNPYQLCRQPSGSTFPAEFGHQSPSTANRSALPTRSPYPFACTGRA